MCAPKAPTPPDPKETSAAQTGTNIGTAIANNTMTMVEQTTPYGALTHTQSGTQAYTDPFTGKTYQIPRYTANTTLSAGEQGILDANTAARTNLAQTGANQSEFLKEYLAQPANFDTSAIEGRLNELGSSRLDPRFAQEEDAMRTRLANQGIVPGSEAYNREMQSMGQTKNDAYNSLYLSGRGQAFDELSAMRNQPINEITALLSGSQVQNPNVQQSQPQGAATTDVAGLINANYGQRMQAWQQDAASQQSLLGGLFGLGKAAIMASDIRVKENIRPIYMRDDGLTVYSFDYVWGGDRQIGVMAQEVEAVYPDAVIEFDGIKHVDYGRLN